VDRNVSQLRQLEEHPNVRIVECDLENLDLEPAAYDLVHTRNVLMHIADANEVIASVVAAVRPGGQVLFEEADYYGLGGITSPLFARVTAPLVAKWDWARSIPTTLSALAVKDLRVTIDASMLHGGSDEAAFWTHTLMASEDRIVGSIASGSIGVTADEFHQALALLADPSFWTPFAFVVCVSATRI
jgi:SAM-dependent methyltransferase